MKTKTMGITITAWITLIGAILAYSSLTDATTIKQAALDQGTVQMLSNILESLDAFRNDRLRDLERIRLATPSKNGSAKAPSEAELYLTPKNSSVSDQIKALKEGIMGHNPVKKTFGYKVTVYTTPVGKDGKDSKPVLVTQYVGGDMKPDSDINRKGEVEDLQESAANQPESQMVHSSESVHIPVHTVSDAVGSEEDVQAAAKGAASDHNRKTEHSASSDKGHHNSHSLRTKLAKGHDHEKHSSKHDEHHKETEKENHRHDTQAHDKGGATQQGIRERTEIEYYEREHFLDTEYDKAKKGHEKTSGVKEHESHNDHDSHENKKLHAKENNSGHKLEKGTSVDKALGTAVAGKDDIVHGSVHYSPPYGGHHQQRPHHSHVDHQDYKEDLQDKNEEHQSSKHHLSEENKGHREHNHEKDHQSENKDTGFVDKDKGRRKEGYRERGYKITAEREYFLNDAHHDKGTASHTSGSRLKDEEGAAHGSKEGERDRGFVKEEKDEAAHDAAYDTKERKYYDGEQHKEDIQEEKSKVTSVGKKQQQEEVLPVVPTGVNYIDPHHHVPIYHPPLPISYAPSNDGAQALIALPPNDLKKSKGIPHQYFTDSKRTPNKNSPKQQPIDGYDDDYEDFQSEGYVGHATYKKRPHSSLISSIKDNIRKDVHRKPPTYSKPKATSEENNSVRFSADKQDDEKYEDDSEEKSEEVVFPEDESRSYHGEGKYPRSYDDDRTYPAPKNARERDLINVHDERHKKVEHMKPYAENPNKFQNDGRTNRYQQPENGRDLQRYNERPLHNADTQRYVNRPETNRDFQRYHDRPENNRGFGNHDRPVDVYTPGIQSPDKLLRTINQNTYPRVHNAKLPTVSEILEEVTRFPQRKANKPYLEGHQNLQENRNQQSHPELKQFYHIGPHEFRQNGQRDNVRHENKQPRNIDHHGHQAPLPHEQQQGHIGNLTPLLNLPQQQQPSRNLNPLDQLHHQQRQLEHLHQQHLQQHQNIRNSQQPPDRSTTLELQQQQTKPPFSPVVLLSRGPSAQNQNQAVDVWYTRQ